MKKLDLEMTFLRHFNELKPILIKLGITKEELFVMYDYVSMGRPLDSFEDFIFIKQLKKVIDNKLIELSKEDYKEIDNKLQLN